MPDPIQRYQDELVFQGVESERCPSFTNALAAGEPVYTEVHSTLADGK